MKFRLIIFASIPLVANAHVVRDSSNTLCLDVDAEVYSNMTDVTMFPCNNGQNQRFLFENDNIKTAENPSYCLTVSTESNSVDALKLWQCNGGENQKFIVDDYSTIRTKDGKCLEFNSQGNISSQECSAANEKVFSINKYCLYDDFSYRGAYFCSNHSQDALTSNDMYSSISVLDTEVSLFEHGYFEGRELKINQNISMFGEDFNDQASSIRVYSDSEEQISNENDASKSSKNIVINDVIDHGESVSIYGEFIGTDETGDMLYLNDNPLVYDGNGHFNTNVPKSDLFRFEIKHQEEITVIDFKLNDFSINDGVSVKINDTGFDIVTDWLRNEINRDREKLNEFLIDAINAAIENSMPLSGLVGVNGLKLSIREIDITPKSKNVVSVALNISNIDFSAMALLEFIRISGQVGPLILTGELNLNTFEFDVNHAQIDTIKINHVGALLNATLSEVLRNILSVWMKDDILTLLSDTLTNLMRTLHNEILNFKLDQDVNILNDNFRLHMNIDRISTLDSALGAFAFFDFVPSQQKSQLYRSYPDSVGKMNSDFSLAVRLDLINKVLGDIHKSNAMNLNYDHGKVNVSLKNASPPYVFINDGLNFHADKLNATLSFLSGEVVNVIFNIRAKINASIISSEVNLDVLDVDAKIDQIKILGGNLNPDSINNIINDIASNLTNLILDVFKGAKIPSLQCLSFSSVGFDEDNSGRLSLDISIEKISEECDVPVIDSPRVFYDRGVGEIPYHCPPGKENSDGLCYVPCEEGFNGIGPVCWNNDTSYERGVGAVPSQCGAGNVLEAGLCYPACKDGFYGSGPLCMSDRQSSYGRGAGWIPGNIITGDCGNAEYDAGLCYHKCEEGYYGVGPVCWLNEPSYDRGAGWVPSSCGSNEVLDGGLCYPLCEEGFEGIGPVCWPDPVSYTRDVGTSGVCKSDQEFDAGLCYKQCRDGYHGVGTTCLPN